MDTLIEFENWKKSKILRINDFILSKVNATIDIPNDLLQPMNYVFNNGGKRIRPQLVYAAGEIYDIDEKVLDHVAASIELIHTYSLIHDDLPCIDNDDTRRGKPSLHKAFSDGIAVITGDAIHDLAYEILLSLSQFSDLLGNDRVIDAIKVLNQVSGPKGMVGGQCIDMTQSFDGSLSEITHMYELKTGGLIYASIVIPMLLSNTQHPIPELSQLAKKIGFLFQLRDDYLELTVSVEELGKPIDSDLRNNKKTYGSIFGIEKLRELILTESSNCASILQAINLEESHLANILHDLDIR